MALSQRDMENIKEIVGQVKEVPISTHSEPSLTAKDVENIFNSFQSKNQDTSKLTEQQVRKIVQQEMKDILTKLETIISKLN